MDKVKMLMESEFAQNLLQENQEIVNEANDCLTKFYYDLNNYIVENITEFLDENLEETSKNIYTFSAYASKQFLTEMSTVYGSQLHEKEILKEAERTEFV